MNDATIKCEHCGETLHEDEHSGGTFPQGRIVRQETSVYAMAKGSYPSTSVQAAHRVTTVTVERRLCASCAAQPLELAVAESEKANARAESMSRTPAPAEA